VLELAGRGNEVISVGGHLVLAADVEAVLSRVGGVAEIVCVGEPHERLGQRVVAVVRPERGADGALVPSLRREARRQLPEPARPVRYVVVEDLPRTAGGKVARGRLAALL
jgi:acyl-coenzyme A synthetase/AMP-(fatty) acid ligase